MKQWTHYDTGSDAGPRLGLRWLYDGPVHPLFLSTKVDPAGVACWYVRRGRVTITTRKQTLSATAGEWIFPARQDARQEVDRETVLLSLRIDAGPPDNVWPVSRDTTFVLAGKNARRLRLLAEALSRACAGGSASPHDPLAAWARQHALIAWVMEAVRLLHAAVGPSVDGVPDPRVAAVLDWVREPGRDFSIAALARSVGLGTSQINRLMIRATGKTARQWWEKERWHRVESALRDPDARPKAIALENGFGSLSQFSRWVRRQTGRPPRAWKSACRRI